ncbi:uncharacterized protein METZ01_LOCUS470300, partial [marine metagenome]
LPCSNQVSHIQCGCNGSHFSHSNL